MRKFTSSKSINEAISQSLSTIDDVDELVDNLRTRLEAIKDHQLYHKLDYVLAYCGRRNMKWSDADMEKINNLLLDYKLTILEWVKENYSRCINDGENSIHHLKNNTELDWPELDDWVYKHKTDIVRNLLVAMKTMEYQAVMFDIHDLWRMEIHWRELDIIADTAEKEVARINREYDADLDDAHADDQDLYEAIQNPNSVNRIISDMIDNPSFIDIGIRRLEDEGLHDKEIISLLTPYRTKLIDALSTKLPNPKAAGQVLILLIELGIKWPELAGVIDKHKTDVVKYLLNEFKLYSHDSILTDGLYTDIQLLKSFGIDWPELDILQKSLIIQLKSHGMYDDDSDINRVDENDDPSNDIPRIIQTMLNNGYVNMALEDLYDSGLSDGVMVKILSPYVDQIIDVLTHKVKTIRPLSTTNAIRGILLLIDIGAAWPKLINVIANNRPTYIKYLLEEFKFYANSTYELPKLLKTLNRLQKVGIDWPELTTIKKSTIAQLTHLHIPHDDENLTEAQPVIPPKIVSNFEQLYQRIHENGIIAIVSAIDKLTTLGATDQQIASLFSERREQVAQFIRNSIHNVSPSSWRTINEAMYVITKLISVGIKWPLLLAILNQYKDKVAAWAIAAADSQFNNMVVDRLVEFKKLGFDIRDIIKQMTPKITANLISTIEYAGFNYVTNSKIQSLSKMGLLPKSFSEQEVEKILNAFSAYLNKFGISKENGNAALMILPNSKDAFKRCIEHNKSSIIKHMLQGMKAQYGHMVVDQIQTLYKFGIKWPEIAIIIKSLNASS